MVRLRYSTYPRPWTRRWRESDAVAKNPPHAGSPAGALHFEAGPGFRAGLALGLARFNRGDHWGSHEAWEAVWLDAPPEEKAFVQGLIQAGAAFHKYVVQDNANGAGRLLKRALQALDPLPDYHHGLDLVALRAELSVWRKRLATPMPITGPVPGLPRIGWAPAAAREHLQVEEVYLHRVAHGDARAILIEARSGGHVGWGECRQSWREHGALAALSESLVPALLALPVSSAAVLSLRWQGLASESEAAAGLEAAIWDLSAKRDGIALTTALAMADRPIPLAARARGGDVASLVLMANSLVDRGFRELIFSARPNADRRVGPNVVRALAAQGAAFAFDLEERYRPSDLYALQVLAGLGPSVMMRPVPGAHVHEAARLQRWLDAPVAFAPVETAEAASSVLEREATDELLVDSGTCGTYAALSMANAAQGHAVAARLIARPVTPIGAHHALAVACHPAFTRPADVGIDGDERPWSDWPQPDATGCAAPRSGPGIGIEPDGWLRVVREGEPTRLAI